MSLTSNDVKEYKKVLVIYVGGTIGMQKNDKGGKYSLIYLL